MANWRTALHAAKPYLYLSPALIVIAGLFLGGVVLATVQSLGYFPVIGLSKFTLLYYRQVIGGHEFPASLGTTIYIALVSTVLSTVAGVYLANYLMLVINKNRILSVAYKLPIAVPHLVAALMMIFLVSQGGMLARLLMRLGLISGTGNFPAFFYSKNEIGIILIYLWKETPFVAVMTYAVMKNIQGRLGEVASTLGASPRQVFYHVVLPLSMPAIVSASAISFAYAFGSYEIPFLLGVSNPQTLPVLAYVNYVSPELSNRPAAMVINMVISVICAGLVALYYLSMKKYLRQWS
jgi:putative spermidine/putrescine transport system permease protein